jgi:glycosyltransferase involved in cell wall biosynthesis
VELKIAMITPWKVKCGIYSYSRDLVQALAKLDVEVYVVRLPRFGLKPPEILVDVAERVPFDKVDLIHVQHEYGLFQQFSNEFYLALKQLQKPIVTTMHAVGNWEVDGLVSAVSKKVIVHNKYCLKRFSFSNTVVIPHGATLVESTGRDEAKKSWGIDPKIPIVGYLGFITNYKGLETLIEAMVEVKNAGLLIGGGWHLESITPYINRLKENSLKMLQNRCRWIGFVPDERLKDAYGAMDLFVYPSRFATESGALITALSYGKAVIASNLPPFREKEKDKALITFKSIADLTSKIQKLLKDETVRHELEEGARQYAEKTSWSKIAEQHICLYESVLKK